ncbi:MAG: hypothetical protein ACM3NO_05355, partial [Deltaproteobacteria bacterium]
MRCKWSIRAGVFSCATAMLLVLAFIASQDFNPPIFARNNQVKPEKAAQRAGSAAAQTKSAMVQASAANGKNMSASSNAAASAHLIESYARIPLSFEMNHGQTNSQVKFLSRGAGYTFFLTPEEAVLALQGRSQDLGVRSQKGKNENSDSRVADPESGVPAVLRMKLLGANSNPKIEGEDELPGKSNYFIGNDPKKWRTNVPNF